MHLNHFTATVLACAAVIVTIGAFWLVARFIDRRSGRGGR